MQNMIELTLLESSNTHSATKALCIWKGDFSRISRNTEVFASYYINCHDGHCQNNNDILTLCYQLICLSWQYALKPSKSNPSATDNTPVCD